MTPAYLALGGNLGAVEQSFRLALNQLASLPQTNVARTSSVHRFPAVGMNAGSEFHNAAARVDTSLEPLELLSHLQRIEDEFGRMRDTLWGPRPLDLDIVFFGNQIIDDPRLQVPHPACWYRRFVLDPLAEIAPDVIHPEKDCTVEALRQRLLGRPLRVAFTGGTASERTGMIGELRDEFPDVTFSIDASSQNEEINQPFEPALRIWLGPDNGSSIRQFESLPIVSRLDASAASDRTEFVRDALHSALGR